MSKFKIIYVDVDGILCTNTYGDYKKAKPLHQNINKINSLFDEGHTIVIWTARGSTSGIDWSGLTKKQLKKWGVRYTFIEDNKPSYDIIIDDRAMNYPEFFTI